MTTPRTYGGGYSTPPFPDTPIYDSLVAERGTPQIAPIRVPSYDSGSHLPALPAARAALPPAPSRHQQPVQQQPVQPYGYQTAPAAAAPQQHAPVPYIPQQASAPRYQTPQPMHQRPAAANGPGYSAGYEAMRPVAPRPAPAPQRPQYPGQQPAQHPDPYGQGYRQPYHQGGQGY